MTDNNESKKDKTINEVISNAEKQILSGDISNVYSEIEKAEQLISVNIKQALIDVFNSIQVMEAKRNYVKFIQDFEQLNIPTDDVAHLTTKATEYRNIDIPKKWNEMNHKLKFTNSVDHFKAWYYGFEQGRYKLVITNVKEYIVKKIIKKILNEIIKKFKDININELEIITLLDKKQISIKEVQITFKKFIKNPDIKKINKDELLLQFESFMIYYLLLNNDLFEEKKIIEKILEDLKRYNNFKQKLKYLIKSKKDVKKTIKNNNLKLIIENIFDKFINLYNILNEKDTPKQKSIKIYTDIIELAEAALKFDGQVARQNFIKNQEDNDKNADKSFKSHKFLHFLITG